MAKLMKEIETLRAQLAAGGGMSDDAKAKLQVSATPWGWCMGACEAHARTYVREQTNGWHAVASARNNSLHVAGESAIQIPK